jgi:DNA-binding transcriptional ArsR family regulator
MKASVLRTTAIHFKALGHLKRLEITTLLQGHSLTVNQIAQMTGLRQATVSQHLIILKDLGLVCTEKMGKEMYYTLCTQPIIDLSNFVKHLTRRAPVENAEPTVTDPICHMSLTPHTASFTAEYDGVRHYFCGKGCLKEFNISHRRAV